MKDFNPNKYKTIIFDLDGVLFDSNHIKGNNIYRASCEFVEIKVAQKFCSYFTGLNGIPRGVKINNFFPNNPEMTKALLDRYNQLNQDTIFEAPLTPGVKEFLRWCKERCTLFVLSGGEENEINKLLSENKLSAYFQKIMGGPLNKSQNLEVAHYEQPVLYFGDSKVDFETAQKFNFDFVFVYGYTQFTEWKEFFKDKNIEITENLETFHKHILTSKN